MVLDTRSTHSLNGRALQPQSFQCGRGFCLVIDKRRQLRTSDSDAVYSYLEAVFAIVEYYRTRRRTNKLLRHAFKFANLPFDKNANPFAAVIRCTCDDEIDSKTISKWARALRYVAHCKVPRMRLKTLMKEAGGINACANLYARFFGRGSR